MTVTVHATNVRHSESTVLHTHASGGTMQPDRSRIFALLTAMLLAGCASVGNESIADSNAETVSRQLIKGRTSQAEVRRIFGDPIKASFASNGNESWEYEFSRMQSKVTNFIPYVDLVHSGAEGDRKSLVILFDRSKVVQDYTMSTSRIDINQGLITR